jgi:hypothetical protein
MRRREFLLTAAAAAMPSRMPSRLAVPVHRIMDAGSRCPPDRVRNFWWSVWPEAAAAFSRGGIDLRTGDGPGEVRRTAADRPVFTGLRRGAVNLVLTDHIPMYWDRGRALAGVTTLHEGYTVCMVALRYAHGNQIPFLSVNTCVHELLHALLQDVFAGRTTWFQNGEREFRVDRYATWLWLFHEGAPIRQQAEQYLRRLKKIQE